jgi:uncharacterized protein YbdZ (MbtH family)
MAMLFMAVLKNNNAMLIESKGEYQIVPVSPSAPSGWNRVAQFPAEQY